MNYPKTKEANTDGCWLQLHGNFTPAHADGCAAQCFEGVQRGSIIILSMHPRLQAATLVFRSGVCRSPVTGVPSCGLKTVSWRTNRLAQHRQIVSVCLILPGRLSFSRYRIIRMKRGTFGADPGISSSQNPGWQ